MKSAWRKSPGNYLRRVIRSSCVAALADRYPISALRLYNPPLMTSIILSIGDELVLGQTVDTNSAWLSRQLAALGVGVLAHQTIGDDQPATEAALRELSGRCDLLLVSGGL